MRTKIFSPVFIDVCEKKEINSDQVLLCDASRKERKYRLRLEWSELKLESKPEDAA